MKKRIRILVVDDSLMMREAIAGGLSKDEGLEVVGKASDPFEARDMIVELEPDVLTLDVEMPRMNGIDFLKQLMPQYPMPVVVVSSLSNIVFEALKAGAVDFVAKPGARPTSDLNTFIQEMAVKVKIASLAKVAHMKKIAPAESRIESFRGNAKTLIAIGASTGGTEATLAVLKTFPQDMPGTVIVQHMPPVFTRMYAERLNASCLMQVSEAQDGDLVEQGKAFVAPGDRQMRVMRDGNGSYRLKCFEGEKVSGHCPSVDVLFDSVADAAKKNAIGVILTGMGADGAKGLLKMRKNGAFTIGQDEKTAVVYGMPMVAFNIGAVAQQAALEEIPGIIREHLK
jgi:two-component system, chemotaxis family, protein-glutamate methylesterase/glutaminase